MKQFTVPCMFGPEGRQTFPIYVGEPNPENHPLKYQSDWLRRVRGGAVPRSVMDSLKRLQGIAIRSHVSFQDLCAYAIGESRRERPKHAMSARATALGSARLPLQVIHNPAWETNVREQDDEKAKLPKLMLVRTEHPTPANDHDPELLNKAARKPKPGVELLPQRRRVLTDPNELQRYPFRHLYDWLRTQTGGGFLEIQGLVGLMLAPELEEEQLMLSSLMLEETQSVLLPHSFAETLDFLAHYEDLHYTLAVILDTGAQYMSRSTYGNMMYLYHMEPEALDELRHRLMAGLRAFATTKKLSATQLSSAPAGFNTALFHAQCAQWFAMN